MIRSGSGPERRAPYPLQARACVYLPMPELQELSFPVGEACNVPTVTSESLGGNHHEQSSPRTLERYMALRNIPLLNHGNLGLSSLSSLIITPTFHPRERGTEKIQYLAQRHTAVSHRGRARMTNPGRLPH